MSRDARCRETDPHRQAALAHHHGRRPFRVPTASLPSRPACGRRFWMAAMPIGMALASSSASMASWPAPAASRRATAALRLAGDDRPSPVAGARLSLRRPRFRRAGRFALRGRPARGACLFRGPDALRAGALRPHQRRHCPARGHPAPGGGHHRSHFRRLPLRSLRLHRPCAARGIRRPRAPGVGDDGHHGPRLRGRDRLPPIRRSRPRTSSSTPGT